jgi:hypothetical protein
LLEFDTVSDAIDAIAVCNNSKVGRNSVKLSFSVNPRITQDDEGDSSKSSNNNTVT